MATVHELPDTMQRQWRVYEACIRRQLAGLASPEETDHAMSMLKPVFLRAATPGEFSGNGEDLVQSINEWVQRLTLDLMMEVVARDVELFRLRGGG